MARMRAGEDNHLWIPVFSWQLKPGGFVSLWYVHINTSHLCAVCGGMILFPLWLRCDNFGFFCHPAYQFPTCPILFLLPGLGFLFGLIRPLPIWHIHTRLQQPVLDSPSLKASTPLVVFQDHNVLVLGAHFGPSRVLKRRLQHLHFSDTSFLRLPVPILN